MSNPTACIIVIGNEILSGRTQDKNIAYIASGLAATDTLVRALLRHEADAGDRHLPLLLWWALESHAEDGREELLALVAVPASWRAPTFRRELAERLGRRFTADQGPRRHYTLRQGVYSEWIIDRAPEHLRRNLEFCARLLEATPGPEEALLLAQGMARGLAGPRVTTPPPALLQAIDQALVKRKAGLVPGPMTQGLHPRPGH